MAKPLKPICPETPILYGEDARRFMRNLKNPKKESPERRQEIMAAYEVFTKVFKGSYSNYRNANN